jgi:hypothetical protein
MKKFLRMLILPTNLRGWSGNALSVLAVIAVVDYGFDFGLDATLLLLIKCYDKVLSLALDWLKPYITSFLACIGWPITLYPHWKHIFVLLGLYFFNGARVEIAEWLDGRRSSPAVRLLLGLFVAFAAGIIAGTFAPAQSSLIGNFLIAAVPFFGTSINDWVLLTWRATYTRVYESGRIGEPVPTWWGYFERRAGGVLCRTFAGLFLIIAGLEVLPLKQLPSPGLAMLGLMVVFLAAFQIFLGGRELRKIHKPGETWMETILRSRGMMIGITMFRVLIWTSGAVVCSVGKRIVFG